MDKAVRWKHQDKLDWIFETTVRATGGLYFCVHSKEGSDLTF
jgi:hypothetical protein